MNRRDFLRTTAVVAIAGSAVTPVDTPDTLLRDDLPWPEGTGVSNDFFSPTLVNSDDAWPGYSWG